MELDLAALGAPGASLLRVLVQAIAPVEERPAYEPAAADDPQSESAPAA